VVVVSRHNHDLATREGTPKLLKKWACGGKCIATRTVAQLQDVSEQDKAIYVGKRLDQSRAGSRPAQHIGARPRPEMEV
jgi:hypothetical protein